MKFNPKIKIYDLKIGEDHWFINLSQVVFVNTQDKEVNIHLSTNNTLKTSFDTNELANAFVSEILNRMEK